MFGTLVRELGKSDLTEIRRQNQAWARDAVRAVLAGQSSDALAAFDERGLISRNADATASVEVLSVWTIGRGDHPLLMGRNSRWGWCRRRNGCHLHCGNGANRSRGSLKAGMLNGQCSLSQPNGILRFPPNFRIFSQKKRLCLW
ncbi:MAG: hypothetical protein HHJ15_16790 [Rhodoferax sp.]|nr:hypothetical protein [Rhodoferax sp.]